VANKALQPTASRRPLSLTVSLTEAEGEPCTCSSWEGYSDSTAVKHPQQVLTGTWRNPGFRSVEWAITAAVTTRPPCVALNA